MKLRALVVEDEWATRNLLVEMLQGSGGADVVGAVANAEAARQALDAASGEAGDAGLDVAFVDVELAGSARESEGLELVRSYAGRPGAPAFVLATAFREHAPEAFDLEVVDYLLKPFTDERVERCLGRVRARRAPASSQPPSRIVARRKRALVFVRLEDVWAFESAERLAYVHTARGRFEVDLSLTAIEDTMGRTLLRVHRSWLVNADHVKELEGYGSETELLVGSPATDEGGVRIPVARDRAQAVREALTASAAGLRPR